MIGTCFVPWCISKRTNDLLTVADLPDPGDRLRFALSRHCRGQKPRCCKPLTGNISSKLTPGGLFVGGFKRIAKT
jgi:hypothetical protein